MEKKSKLGVLTQTKHLCKSSLSSSVRKTTHLRETTERTDLQRYGQKKQDRYFFS